MKINFCPRCGKKAEDEFNFCPYCGLKFPREEAAESEADSDHEHTHQPDHKTPVKFSPQNVSVKNEAICSPSNKGPQIQGKNSSPPKTSGKRKCMERNVSISPRIASTKSCTPEKEQARTTESPSVILTGKRECMERNVSISPRIASTKSCTPEKEQARTTESPSVILSEMSPRSKKAKNVQVQPLPENYVLTDNNKTTKWVLTKLLTKEKTGFYYEVDTQSKSGNKQHSVLKLDAKDGKIFHEQNFFQRAARKMTVDKWKKSYNCPALGIPNCIGFGVHDDYRFLVFSALGRNLQTIINENNGELSERALCHILYRMIDVLEYIHENEYVHGDITAENIYVNSDSNEVYLAGYYNAFRYCPGGKHVTYSVDTKTPHEGTAEFISLDVHKGTAPTRRSDLESLGYCMLKWLCGSLPWSGETNPCSIMEQKIRFKTDLPGLLKQCFQRRKIPDVLKLYLEQVMKLDYVDKPEYAEIRGNVSSVLEKVKTLPYDPVKL
ncbi:serine/threonine-protein kinase VRK3 isoform X2 [Rhinoderma darwinii]|uniref:serine/threonine-protein kinase VRK3 isoform X2 n=1 Tax=Rhinoderma darwinii TaxID=43563 RepID=UPI003F680DF9